MADPDVVARKDGKASRTTLVEVETGYIVDGSYKLRRWGHREIGPTGLLKVFELTPGNPNSGLPVFIGRWDERADSLDVDITGTSEAVIQFFRSGKAGYRGHHPTRLRERRFAVEIRTPATLVFRGVVSFGLGRDLALGDSVQARATVEAILLRGGQIAPEKSTSLPAAEDGKLGTEERIQQRRGARHGLTVAIGVFIAILALLVMFGLPMFMHW